MRAFVKTFVFCVWAVSWVMAVVSTAMAAEVLPGPIPATLVRVIDGDTVEVRARIWLGQQVQVAVRLAGIDAPELRGKCVVERDQAEAAAAHLLPLEGTEISLTNIANDKFGGRVRADIHHAEMGALAASLMDAGLARPYHGGRRSSWCTDVAARQEQSADPRGP
eukprot:s1_g1765.t1